MSDGIGFIALLLFIVIGMPVFIMLLAYAAQIALVLFVIFMIFVAFMFVLNIGAMILGVILGLLQGFFPSLFKDEKEVTVNTDCNYSEEDK